MRIAKLTWLYNGNYGSVLQALALQKFLEENGYDVVDLNYKPSIVTKLLNWVKNHNSLSLFLDKYKSRENKKNIKEAEKFEIRAKRFEKFKKDNMKLTKLCRNPKDLKNISKEFDVFVCGSDQIWSPKLMNPVFYFSFLKDDKIKVSYAPSFGVTETNKSKKKKMAKLLNKFDYISVRETQGQDLIKELTGKNVPVQVDPTMLLNEKQWEKYIDEKAIINKKYVFCYLLTPNEEYINNIKEFAKNKKLDVVIVPTEKGPFETGFEEYPDAGPSEWLNLIKNAEYVFTDSFHGCIFSVIFHREVFLYKRFSDNSKKSENSRVYTLTKWLNIEERLIDKESMKNISKLKEIDYAKVEKILQKKSNDSAEWLKKTMKESENKIKKNEKRK